MRKILVLFLMPLVVSLFANIVDVVELAKQNSVTYLKAVLNFEQARNDYDKALIEAKNKRQQLVAQQSWLRAQQNYNQSLKNFYSEFFDTYIGVLENALQAQIAQNKLKIAEIDFTQLQDLYKTGAATLQDLQSASSTKLSAEVSFDEATLNLQQSKEDLLILLGKEVQTINPSLIKVDVELPSIEKLISRSFVIQIAEIDVQIAQMDYDSLVNPSTYIKSKYERILKIAQSELKDTQNSTKKSYQSLLLATENLKKTIQAQRETVNVTKAELESAERNYKIGVGSEKDLLQARNTYLTAQKSLLGYVRAFLKNLCSLYIDAGLDYQQLLSAIFGG